MKSLKCHLFIVLMLSSVSAFAIPPAPRARIVAKVDLKGQTADIPTTTLFTPKSDGFFRITVYMITTVANPSSSGHWLASVLGQDDSGAWAQPNWLIPAGAVSNSVTCCGSPLETTTLRDNAGSPLTYSVTGVSNPAGSTYEIFIVVEQLM